MLSKKQQLSQLFSPEKSETKTLFRPILMHFAARYHGHTYGEFASDHKVLVDCNLKCLDDFDMDMVGLISDPYRETAAFGAPIEFIPEGVPKCLKTIISTYDDVKNLKNPDVYQADRTRDRIQGAALYQKILKGNVPVIGWIEGPLAEACDLVGVSQMYLQLMMDPDFSHLLMDKCMTTARDFAKAQIESGCDLIGIGDAVCSQIDAQTYETYVLPRHQEIVQFIQGQGAKVKFHICGNITHLLPAIKLVKPDILDLDWQVDIDYARQVMGPDSVLCGNINPIEVQDKNRDEVYETAYQLIQKYKGQPYILSAGCEITVNTPPDNLKALREASLQ